jgi:hypothetical protein
MCIIDRMMRYGFGCPTDPSQLKVVPGHHSHPGFAEDDS